MVTSKAKGKPSASAIKRLLTSKKLTTANQLNSLLEDQKLEVEGHQYTLRCTRDLAPTTLDRVFDLFKENMREMYERSKWGYNETKLKNEYRDKDSRFLIVTEDGNDNLCGFCHFQFVEEDEHRAVAYCLDIQISKSSQGRGLGRWILEKLFEIGKKAEMEAVMLTCFKFNEPALRFYRDRQGLSRFETDENCPSVCDSSAPLSYDYVILSKKIQ
ncbi:hypothetical protein PROFUN_07471 [Planoprotostelium fungivorum]|uniref:N-alpha-acetyltransferase 40 n=1 Tax=Planoprotostelium fungivorum TaxID=1890364 RepID=A0A2P6NLI8_9EUKA|nr:hypothetical protein PROFUN_07471 [Planoprotostelium fungivorum]